MKKYVLILASIILYSFTCFAQEREVFAPGENGPIYKDSQNQVNTQEITINTAKLVKINNPNEILKNQKQVVNEGAILIGDHDPVNTTNPVTSPIVNTINMATNLNVLPMGGTFSDGFTWGLNRMAYIMNKNGKNDIQILSCIELPVDTESVITKSYKVNISSSNAWRNGNWQVDIYPIANEYRKILDGYISYFGYYDQNRMFIGVAQAKKV